MYKINVIGHMLKGGKVAKAGDLVAEKQLNSPTKELLDKGFIVKASKEEVDAQDKKEKASESKDLDEMTKKELLEYADKNEIEVDAQDKKEVVLQTIKDA